jgi:hypothetical protein
MNPTRRHALVDQAEAIMRSEAQKALSSSRNNKIDMTEVLRKGKDFLEKQGLKVESVTYTFATSIYLIATLTDSSVVMEKVEVDANVSEESRNNKLREAAALFSRKYGITPRLDTRHNFQFHFSD